MMLKFPYLALPDWVADTDHWRAIQLWRWNPFRVETEKPPGFTERRSDVSRGWSGTNEQVCSGTARQK